MTDIDLYPTPTRKKLARDIEAGKVRWYWWASPWASNTADGGRKVTADVKLLEHHGLAKIRPLPDSRDTYSLVRLTDTGRVWAGIETEPCVRCKTFTATGPCCSSHDKKLCHACYRRTHFVEVCVEGCALCADEGLPVLLAEHGGAS